MTRFKMKERYSDLDMVNIIILDLFANWFVTSGINMDQHGVTLMTLQ